MSAPASSPHAPSDSHGHSPAENRFMTFVQLAMLLAVITGLELVTVYLPFPKWTLVTTLVVLSAVKFLLVIFYFMHLKWDKVFCSILFFIGMILAGGTMWALLQLFGADASRPLEPTTASLHAPASPVGAAGHDRLASLA